MKLFIGDITNVQGFEAIANPTDQSFTPGGGLARWIEKKAGREVYTEVQKKTRGKKVNIGDSYWGSAGKLNFKAIAHIPTINWNTKEALILPEVHMVVIKTCEKALEKGYRSIVFPLLGTGTIGLDSDQVLEETVDALIHFEKDFSDFNTAVCILKESQLTDKKFIKKYYVKKL